MALSGATVTISGNSGSNVSFSVNGVTSPTLQGYGPTAAALVDMTPDTGTFTVTYTGFTANPTGTAVWNRIGNLVMLFLPALTGTSNAVGFTATGIPNAINPARTQILGGQIFQGEDNSAGVNLGVRVETTNTITFSKGGFPLGAVSNFTNTGTKGIATTGVTLHYLLN